MKGSGALLVVIAILAALAFLRLGGEKLTASHFTDEVRHLNEELQK